MFIMNNSQDEIINVSNITNDDTINNRYLSLEIFIIFIIFIIIILVIYFNDKENRYLCRKKNKIKPII